MAEVNDTLGWVYYKMNLAERAVPAFLDATKASPNNPVFQYHLGLAYSKVGESEKARQAFDVALRYKPNYPEAAKARQATF